MRLIQLITACCALVLCRGVSFAAGATEVHAIAFVASHQPGATDPRLAPYEAVLRANLRFESFRSAGESSAKVSAGGHASLSVPGGGHVELEADANGTIQARKGGTAVTLGPGHPAVFMGGPAGNGSVSGVIIML